MFKNLVESGKHTNDFKRKGSFFLATIIAYSFFLVSAGIASVFAYDAHLENQSLEIVALLSPVPVDKPEPQKQQEQKAVKSSEQKSATRTDFIDRADNPRKTPDEISSKASNTPPIPKGGNVVIGPTNTEGINMPGPPSIGAPNGNDSVSKNTPLVIDTTPPPPSKKKAESVAPKKDTIVSKGVITGQATSLPKPAYPTIAKNAHVSGEVRLQVVVDETGKVISANVISGHPLLSGAARQAAMQARFKPTTLSGDPVKVTGIITYNFSL